jgi:PAS domain S-box-containing protein
MFQLLFERSADAIWLFDPQAGVFVDCNAAAVELMGAGSKEKLLQARPEDLSPHFQPDGTTIRKKTTQVVGLVEERGGHRFEWVARRFDGHEIPLEALSTPIDAGGRSLHVVVSRDITERKKAERELLELNQSLERRVAERTVALTTSEHALREANRELRREIEQRSCAEELLNERIRTFTLGAEVALALNAGTELKDMLQQCAELAVRHLDVAFARIWTLNESGQILELQASAGCYTHLNGPHSRVPVGQYKIGLIAQEKKPHLTNEVQTDARVSDKAWAAREGMVAFAGYPLLLEDRVLGVLAVFARRSLAGDVLRTLGSVADSIALGIERKRAQSALTESEARFSAAFQSTPILNVIARMSDGRIVLVNDAFVDWSGYTRDEILGKDTLELGVWEHQQDRAAFWADLRRTGSIRELEIRICNRSGKLFTMLMCAKVIQLDRAPHVLAVALDITGRKEAEAESRATEARLRESEARFSAAFNASPALIGILRVCDGKYVLVNDAHLNWLGYQREEVLGRTCLELGMWENPSERDLLLKDMDAFGSVRQRECRWRNRSGGRFTVLLSAEIIKLNDTPHLLLMTLDITQRKRAEEELVKTLEREKELSHLKSNFVSMVSHEFRTPLGIIQSSAELLRDFQEKMQPGEREDQLTSIARNTRRMADMMEEVLVLSRLDAGKLNFQPAALDLSAFCRCVLDEVLSATNRRCPIELSLISVLPEAEADERLLAHIFTNLLSNAVKYSEPGATVHFTVEQDGPDAVCTIRDQGIGISEEDRQQLFKAFYRGANVGARPGTGLGLLLVKRCADLHGGKVQLHSKLGEGTTVIVRLPVFGETP